MMRETAPPPELKRKIAARLRREGLLRRSPVPWAVAAVLAIAIAAAIMVQRPTPHARYILLLYESRDTRVGSHAEYSAWARQMRPLVVGGEELHDEALLAVNQTPSSPRLAGYFLLGATDDATAARVARACPHIRHGGGVVLKKIVM